MGIFQDYLCFIVICLICVICIAVMVKIIRDRRANKRRRLLKRNSLQKYPSFVANRIITGVFTIIPPGQLYKSSRRLSDQYIIAVAPPIDFYDSSLGFYERLYPYPGRAVRRESDTTTSSEFEFDLHHHYPFPMEQQIECEEEDENNNIITMRIHNYNDDH